MPEQFLFEAITSSVNGQGIIEAVSVITKGEAKGHGTYIDDKTLEMFLALAQEFPKGVKVKADHGTGFKDIVGTLRNFRLSSPSPGGEGRGEGGQLACVRADLHLLKNHSQFATIQEMADTMPGEFGLSIVFSGPNEEIDGKKYARPVELYSIDLVDHPAANPNGLFSSPSPGGEGRGEGKRPLTSESKAMTKETFLAKAKAVATALGINFEDDSAADVSADLETKLSAIETKVTELAAEKTSLTAQVVALTTKTADLETQNSALKTQHLSELAAKDASVETLANTKASAIVAKAGHAASLKEELSTAVPEPKTYTERCQAANRK